MADVFDDVVSYFKKEHADCCTVDNENKSVTMRVEGNNEVYGTFCQVREAFLNIFFLGILKIPKEKTAQACLLANMINAGAFAPFIISPEDGDLMVRMSFAVEGCKLSHDAMKITFGALFEEVDKYYPAFQKLIWADLAPEEAFNSVNADKEQ